MRRLILGQRALLLDRERLRLGEGSFKALDLASQLRQLRRVGLDRERRFRGLLGLVGDLLGLGLRSLVDLLGSDFHRHCVGLDRLSLRNLRYLIDFRSFLVRHDLIGLSRDLVGLWLSRNGGELGLLLDGRRLGCYVLGGLGARSRRGDCSRGQPELGKARTRLLRVTAFVHRRGAECEAVLGSESAAALHRQRVSDRGTRRKAELHDDLAEGALRLLLDLENGRELLLADQPELGHQLTELALRQALSLGGRTHASSPLAAVKSRHFYRRREHRT